MQDLDAGRPPHPEKLEAKYAAIMTSMGAKTLKAGWQDMKSRARQAAGAATSAGQSRIKVGDKAEFIQRYYSNVLDRIRRTPGIASAKDLSDQEKQDLIAFVATL